MVTFLLPFLKQVDSFPTFAAGKLVGLLEINPWKVWNPSLRLEPQQFLTLKLVHTQPPGIHQIICVPASCWFLWQLLLLVSCDSQHPLLIHFSLPGKKNHLPSDHTSLRKLKRAIVSQFVQIFSCCKNWSGKHLL